MGVLWRPHNNGQQLTTEEIQLERGIIASGLETPQIAHLFNTLYFDNSFNIIYIVSERINFYCTFSISYDYLKHPLIKKGYEFHNSFGLALKLQ